MQLRAFGMPWLVAVAIACGHASLPAAAQPITLSIIDVGGDLSSMQAIVENYRKANPNKVKDIRIQRAPQPELPAKIKAQQDAGRLDINLIMTGQAAASALIANGQLVRLLPDHEKLFPLDDFTEAAKAHLKEGEGYVIPSVVSNGGPVFIFNPKKVPNPPKTAQELLAWAKANPGKFFYARPANSGPGTSILRRPAVHPRRQGSRAIRRTAGTRPGRSSRSSASTSSIIRPARCSPCGSSRRTSAG